MRASRPSGAERTTTVDEKKSLYIPLDQCVLILTPHFRRPLPSLSLSPLRNRPKFPLLSRWTKPSLLFFPTLCMHGTEIV